MAELTPLKIHIYAEARRMFALGLWGWPALVLNAFLVGDDYLPDLEGEVDLARVTPVLATTVAVGNATDDHGFNTIDPIEFVDAILTQDATQFVLAADSGVPILYASFPAIRASLTPITIPVFTSTTWLFRL